MNEVSNSAGFFAQRALAQEQLFLSGAGTDVTFELPDGKVSAHKCILMTHAPYFARLFASDMMEARSGVVEVTDFKARDFKTFLGFIYSGLLRDPFDMEQMICLANKYDVPALIDACLKKVGSESNRDSERIPRHTLVVSFEEHFRLADRQGIPKFRQGCEDLLHSFVDTWTDSREEIFRGCQPGSRQHDRDAHDLALNHVVELLVFAQRHSCQQLKKKCLSHFMKHNCGWLDQDALAEKLKDHPDVWREIVKAYHLKLKMKKLKIKKMKSIKY